MKDGICAGKRPAEQIQIQDAAIYELLLERYSLKAEECVFLDDTPINVETAKKVGLHSFVFVEKDQAEKELEKL